MEYYLKYTYYIIIFVISSLIIKLITRYIIITNIFMWVIVALITFIIYNLIILMLFHNTEEFKYFYNKFKSLIKKIIKK